jgi:hypothetical protein
LLLDDRLRLAPPERLLVERLRFEVERPRFAFPRPPAVVVDRARVERLFAPERARLADDLPAFDPARAVVELVLELVLAFDPARAVVELVLARPRVELDPLPPEFDRLCDDRVDRAPLRFEAFRPFDALVFVWATMASLVGFPSHPSATHALHA